jgi:hypothetical protein
LRRTWLLHAMHWPSPPLPLLPLSCSCPEHSPRSDTDWTCCSANHLCSEWAATAPLVSSLEHLQRLVSSAGSSQRPLASLGTTVARVRLTALGSAPLNGALIAPWASTVSWRHWPCCIDISLAAALDAVGPSLVSCASPVMASPTCAVSSCNPPNNSD